MKYSDFEKHLASELERAEAPVQMDSLLSALNLSDKPKRRPFGVFIIIPMFLLLGGLAYLALSGSFSSTNDQNSSQQYSDSQSGISNSTIQSYADQTRIQESDEVVAAMSTSSSDSEFNGKVNQNSRINNNQQKDNNQEKINQVGQQQESLSRSQINNRNNRNNSQKLSSELTSAVNNKTFKSRNQNSISTNTNVLKEGRGNLETARASSSLSPGFEAYSPSNRQSNNVPVAASTNDNSSEISIRESNSLGNKLELDPLKNRRSLLTIDELENENDDLFSRMKINCPSFNQAHWRLALIPEVGILAPIKTLALKSGESNAAYDLRKANETSLEGVNLGIYGMLVRDKMPFFLKAGLSYTKISERMELEYNFTDTKESFGVIGVTVSANGDSITTIEGPIIVETVYTGKNTRHHYVHLVDLPVSIGYTAYVGGFDIAIEGGVKVNLMTRATGNQLVGRRTYDNLSFSQSFKRKVGLSYFGGLMIGRNLGRFGDFYIAPRFHYYPDDFTSAKNTVSQKYVTLGINAGVIYKI